MEWVKWHHQHDETNPWACLPHFVRTPSLTMHGAPWRGGEKPAEEK